MATISVTFDGGDGTLNIKHYRSGTVIKEVTLTDSGSIDLNTQRLDVISLGGSCTGTADITVDVNTSPSTPIHDEEGPINHSLRVK